MAYGDGNRGKGRGLAFLRANVGYAGDDCLMWPFSRNIHGYGAAGYGGKIKHETDFCNGTYFKELTMTQPDKAALADRIENLWSPSSIMSVPLDKAERALIVAALRSADGMREELKEICGERR